jgi:hypothetical protein
MRRRTFGLRQPLLPNSMILALQAIIIDMHSVSQMDTTDPYLNYFIELLWYGVMVNFLLFREMLLLQECLDDFLKIIWIRIYEIN